MSDFAGHTPGPWYVGTQNDALHIITTPPRPAPVDYMTAGSPDTFVIARLYALDRAEDANAALIAAAPTLLAQRDALAEALREIRRESIPAGNDWGNSKLVKMCDAALARLGEKE